jgi:hypothetical protein
MGTTVNEPSCPDEAVQIRVVERVLAARGKTLLDGNCDSVHVASPSEVDRDSRRLVSAPDHCEDGYWTPQKQPDRRKQRRGSALEAAWCPDAEQRAH